MGFQADRAGNEGGNEDDSEFGGEVGGGPVTGPRFDDLFPCAVSNVVFECTVEESECVRR